MDDLLLDLMDALTFRGFKNVSITFYPDDSRMDVGWYYMRVKATYKTQAYGSQFSFNKDLKREHRDQAIADAVYEIIRHIKRNINGLD